MAWPKPVVHHRSKVVDLDSDFEDNISSQANSEQIDQRTAELRSKFKHNKDRVNSKMVRMLEADCNNENIAPLKKKKKVSKEPIVANVEDDDTMDEDEDPAVSDRPKLRSRACPTLLFNAIANFRNEQQRAVVEIGFSHILNMSVSKVPTHLAHWVLDNFDANSLELCLRNGCSIPVDAEDVHLDFGFPRGGSLIQRRKKSDVDLGEKFYKQFGQTKRDRIKLKVLHQKMMVDISGAPLLRYMDNKSLKSIHELDWCKYVIRSLIEHKWMWENNKANSFGGPILFLTAKYVDRVVSHGKRFVDKSFPMIKEDEMQKFVNEFLAKSKLMADTMMQLILMIERALKHLCDNPRFKKIVEIGQQLIGCKLGGDSLQDNARPSQFYEQDDDDAFWSDPVFIAALDEIEKTILKRDE
ncbi:hypothetical protein C2S51_007915 [Perilla frutescens var. frutescens]|nr:hypothetical protein C2S51_007915 [Perilla frutescens var. frutescens]